jgi:hypothetical protein
MANRYIRAAGGNYNAAGTWELTAGGGETVAVPTASDDVIGTALSGQLTITATAVAQTVDLSAYTSTLTHNAFSFGVSGNVTFGAGMTYTPAETAVLAFNAVGTLTTGGKLMTRIQYSSNSTMTLADNLSFAAFKTCSLNLVSTTAKLDMNGFSVNGNSTTNRVLIFSNILGTAKTITNATTSFTNADFRDITFSSASSLDLSAITGLSGDCGGNTITGGGSTLTFTTGATQTATGSSANWSAATWSGRVPLPQDDVVLSLTAGQTLTADMPRLGKSISATTAMTLVDSVANTIYGGLNLTNLSTFTFNDNTTFEGRSSYTLTMAGKSFGNAVTIAMVGGTLTLGDAYNNGSSSTILTNGTFIDAGFNFSSLGWSSNVSTTRAVTKTGTWTISGSGSRWTMTTTTGLTWSDTAGSILYQASSSGTFNGGGLTYYAVTLNQSAGTPTVAGSNTFTTLTIPAGKTVTFTSGTTQTFSDFVATGTAGNLITLNTSAAGAATLTASRTVPNNNDYMSITNVNVTDGTFFYGGHSTYVSGTGWKQGNSADMFRSLY